MNIMNPVELSQDLIKCPSVTPEDAGALDVLQGELTKLGFDCQRMMFSDKDTPDVDNLYARLGTGGKNLCFAGHTDVVPAGDMDGWDLDPFSAEIKEGILFGRGAVDMKCAIASWVAAVSEYIEINKEFDGSISLLITGDEEGPAINGTRKMLKTLEEKGEKFDGCIVGEPTNPKRLGEMIKTGRRGSVNFKLTVDGVQGHAAYPHLADNPMPKLLAILGALTKEELDRGTEYFDPSNLEITSIDSNNEATNIIPGHVSARFNIRFNDLHTCKTLHDWIVEVCDEVTGDYELEAKYTGEAFHTTPGPLSDCMMNAVEVVTGAVPELSTTGGTSDARYIKDYCPVVEFGLTNETAHKVNECAKVEDIEHLTQIYLEVLKGYF